MRPASGSISSSIQLSRDQNNNYETGLLEEEKKYEFEPTEQTQTLTTFTQTQTQLQIKKANPSKNYVPAQNVLRVSALSLSLSSGYAINSIAVFRSMSQGINNKELWTIFYVLSGIWLSILCFGMTYFSFRGIKAKYIKLIVIAYLIGGSVQFISLLMALSNDNHGYICWQFELVYSFLPFYIIYLIYFFQSTTLRIKMIHLAIYSFILFITPCLRFLMYFYESTVCVALIVTFSLISVHMWCFYHHINSGLFIKLGIITCLMYSLYAIILIGATVDFDKYYTTDRYRIYYYYILLAALYMIYACELFIKVPAKIIKKSIQHLQDRDSFNVDIEKYDGTVKLSMSNKPKPNTYRVQSLFDIAKAVESDNSEEKNYNPYFKSINPNKKIESVIKIFPDFKPCAENKDKYFSEFNIGDIRNKKDMERLKDSITAIVPFYNESAHEIYATLRSLYLNFDYLKKTQTKYNFTHFNVLLVGDGWFKSDLSTQRYLLKLYNCAKIDHMFNHVCAKKNKHNTVILQTKGNQKLCINPFNNSDHKLFLKVTTIIKIDNRKKANSHEWYLGKYGFAEWCKCDFMYFTDAYSTLNPKGLYQMVMHMKDKQNKDVVCCTGRARVYTFKQELNFKKMIREDIDEIKEQKLAKKKKKKRKKKIDYSQWWRHEIFDMKEEDIEDSCSGNSVYNIMDKKTVSEQNKFFSVGAHLRNCQMFEFEALYGTIGSYLLGGFLPVIPGPCGFYRSEYALQDSVRGWYFDKIHEKNDVNNINLITGNMQLAEDRVLTITSILNYPGSVRHSLIPDCVFYFDPQPNLTQLMKQRRRWINGSIATVIYVLRNVAFEEWQVNWFRKQYVLCTWYVQLAMYAVLFISPPIMFIISFNYGLATILRSWTHITDVDINVIVISLQIIAWAIYLLYIYYAQKTDKKDGSHNCNLKTSSVRLMMFISYTFGILTVIGSIMQFVALIKLIVKDPNDMFRGELNVFNFFVMTMEAIFTVQSFILAPLFSKDIKTLLILLKTGFWYFIYSPFYVIFFFIYAIANVHDLSWGTRPDNQNEIGNKSEKNKKNPKHTTHKILVFLVVFNIIIAVSIQPLSQFFYARMIFFGVLAAPAMFVIIFSVIWLLKTNVMALLKNCAPKKIDDQYLYVCESVPGLSVNDNNNNNGIYNNNNNIYNNNNNNYNNTNNNNNDIYDIYNDDNNNNYTNNQPPLPVDTNDEKKEENKQNNNTINNNTSQVTLDVHHNVLDHEINDVNVYHNKIESKPAVIKYDV